MKSSLQSQELFVYTDTKSPLYIQTHILLLVLIGDLDFLAILLEIVVSDSPKSIMLHRKCLVKYTIYVIVTILEWGMEREHCEQAIVIAIKNWNGDGEKRQ